MPGELWVHCPYCDADFTVPESLRGGHANCTQCRRAVEVGHGIYPLFWALLGMGVLFVVGLAAFAFMLGGTVAGFVILGVGALIITAVVLAS
ncbi:MAG: hypothetical protein ACE5KM_23080 [Planctomycetaceae bacterium]